MPQNSGVVHNDGSDSLFGLENFGNICYGNAILQVLFHSEVFRRNVINYLNYVDTIGGRVGGHLQAKITVRNPLQPSSSVLERKKTRKGTETRPTSQRRLRILQSNTKSAMQEPRVVQDAVRRKKDQAMSKGPVLDLMQEHVAPYGIHKGTFTGLKDIFLTLVESTTRGGVFSARDFLEKFQEDNEISQMTMQQDVHEFYGLVLNDIMSEIEAHSAKSKTSTTADIETAELVQEVFQGRLSSKIKCLTCESTTRRYDNFLNLSLDPVENVSITSCLLRFSADDVLCGQNKFFCDHCGALQEATRSVKIEKIPRVLALHLKRLEYNMTAGRLQKLFHRVVYPRSLRIPNASNDGPNRDSLYELYAVVVHIGESAYHGHYVSIIKTRKAGWMLFDDEMVESVDEQFIQRFFGGDSDHTATAYMLFYQVITEKIMQRAAD